MNHIRYWFVTLGTHFGCGHIEECISIPKQISEGLPDVGSAPRQAFIFWNLQRELEKMDGSTRRLQSCPPCDVIVFLSNDISNNNVCYSSNKYSGCEIQSKLSIFKSFNFYTVINGVRTANLLFQ